MKKMVSSLLLAFIVLILSGCSGAIGTSGPKITTTGDEFSSVKTVRTEDNRVGGLSGLMQKAGLYMDVSKTYSRNTLFWSVLASYYHNGYGDVIKDYDFYIGGLCTFRADDVNIPVKLSRQRSDVDVDVVGNPGSKRLSVDVVAYGSGLISDADFEKIVNAKELSVKCGQIAYKKGLLYGGAYKDTTIEDTFQPTLIEVYNKFKELTE
ncbi:MAG: lipoprotein [Campylobacteraceae bacterium]|jgi:hypothetical protein|nr:lipoprotein [Campylobacteraceae bacterium]